MILTLTCPASDQKRIVDLFGAGATDAELSKLGTDVSEFGLLRDDATRGVILRAKQIRISWGDTEYFWSGPPTLQNRVKYRALQSLI